MVASHATEATPPTDDLGHTIVFVYNEYTDELTAAYSALHPFLIDFLSLVITPGEAHYSIDVFLDTRHDIGNELGFYARIVKRR